MQAFGIILAFVALLGWGFGDFFIQKTTRMAGLPAAMAFVSCASAIALYPFARPELSLIRLSDHLELLALLAFCVLFSAISNMHALQIGKLSVVAPIVSLELPLTIGFSLTLANEYLTPMQALSIVGIMSGILLVALRRRLALSGRRVWIERGVFLSLSAAVFLALGNFLTGLSSQRVSPIVAVWFTETAIGVVMLFYHVFFRHLVAFGHAIRNHYPILLLQTACTTGAWLSFAYATRIIPISITTSISEGYVALAAILGVIVNREKIKTHQIAGIAIVSVGISLLALLSA